MQALSITTYGGPEVVHLEEDAPVPMIEAGHLLVRVRCAGINFMDIHTRQGKYANSRTYPVRLPTTLGMEGAGDVVEVGEGVTGYAVGDRVAWCIAWGSHAEYVSIPAARAAKLSDDIGYDLAAAAIFQGSTAHYLVEDVARLVSGSTCLVHAAAGSIGQLLVQMAKRKGATVIATASDAAKREVARARGADIVLPYDDGAFADAVRAATEGEGVDVVFDAVGRATLRDSFRATRTCGLVVNYGSVSGSVQDLDPIELGESGSLFLTRPRLADHMQTGAVVQARADAVFAAIRDGDLTIDFTALHGLENVRPAHARIEARQQIGKEVVWIQ